MASEAAQRGMIRVELTEQYASLIWRTMQLGEGCTPEEALGYLLAIARGELDSGAWDGSTARQGALEGVRVLDSNLEDIPLFEVGQVVWVDADRAHGRGTLVGTVVELGPVWAQLDLSKGTLGRWKTGLPSATYEVRVEDLQEL